MTHLVLFCSLLLLSSATRPDGEDKEIVKLCGERLLNYVHDNYLCDCEESTGVRLRALEEACCHRWCSDRKIRQHCKCDPWSK
ncbi:hypothetical protein PRIPAC_97659 [Pristionchus pacificus]|uniref:Uncharacterized protein n=1 Tax=Pristionchus pacificus TaxID=54126 RepID=A0A2A6BJX4_PRIPA|nr:hypothetical protein PRIPAC_97659 [Pristionchus pacificus]|eukprot:PDM66091.1 hypothetical protein PRIPAC_45316 [Pristionchus pacificus]